MKTFGGNLKNWNITYNGGKIVVKGNIYGSPLDRYPDGMFCRKENIIKLNTKYGVVETENNIYHLQN
ncbi:MAG: hypothetical protein GWN01_17735 [Nitrosopumilaceae archaeon]|nr:hypothetical protein [Nitrosopumilaceae archaeon]NIU89118.1 hypothetical protein [Nitrosopumilaceae archaeon]NIV65315.1 hypothetical protein [Nitrosopumilaceae archaeon]NIX63264.1 hypothetical protein [Nitrosopumilaceae archaeon]